MPVAKPPGSGRDSGHAKIAQSSFLIRARWVVPVEPAGAVFEHHAVVVGGGAIGAILPAREAAERFPPHQVHDLPRPAPMPGLVNPPTPAAVAVVRGVADAPPLMRWPRGPT